MQNQIENLTLLSLGQANLTLEVFRDLHQKSILEKNQAIKDAVALATDEYQTQLVMDKGGNNAHTQMQVKIFFAKILRKRKRERDIDFSVRHQGGGAQGSSKTPKPFAQRNPLRFYLLEFPRRLLLVSLIKKGLGLGKLMRV